MSILYANNSPTKSGHLVTTYTFKHILAHTDHYLVEVRNDLCFGESITTSFQWLKVSKDLLQIKAMTHQSSDSSWDLEERFFEEGYLKFGTSNGIFIEKFNSAQHQYQILSNLDGAKLLTNGLQRFFAQDQLLMN